MCRKQFTVGDRVESAPINGDQMCEACGFRAGDHVYQFAGDSGHYFCPVTPGPIEHIKEVLKPERFLHLDTSAHSAALASALETQVGGSHYKDKPIQPIEYCHKNKLGPCESAIVKYITRWRDKGGKQDLEKIKHYVDLLIQLEGL